MNTVFSLGTSDAVLVAARRVSRIFVVFELPDGSQDEGTFQMGQTVEVLKSHVENEFSIPMATQQLFIGETLLLDPLSLLDYPQINPSEDTYVRVEGEMADDAKK